MWDPHRPLTAAVGNKRDCRKGLTSVLTTRLDDFGPTFSCVLHSLGHALPGHLVGVIGGTHCDLVVYCRQQCQVWGPWARDKEGVWRRNVMQERDYLPAMCGKKVTVDSADQLLTLPRRILMDALEASLRVVLAHIRQIEFKIVEGVWRRVTLGNLNALSNNSHTY